VTISFEGQVAIVTGAGRGLGRDYALEIARRGGAVVIADIGLDAATGQYWAQAVVQEIESAGGRAVAATETVATSSGGRGIVETAMDVFGRIDVLIHNAGFLRPGFFDELSDDAIRDIFDVHVMGAFNVGRPAWTHMKRQVYGRIVLTSSGSVFGYHASSNYASAKAAMIGLATALGNEGATHGILANAIMPLAQSDIGKENPVPGSSMQLLKAKLEALEHRWRPNSVTNLVTYLASRDCAGTGHTFSAVAGRYGRVALAVSEGWLSLPDIPTAEEIRDHFPQVESLASTVYPESMIAEMLTALDRL